MWTNSRHESRWQELAGRETRRAGWARDATRGLGATRDARAGRDTRRARLGAYARLSGVRCTLREFAHRNGKVQLRCTLRCTLRWSVTTNKSVIPVRNTTLTNESAQSSYRVPPTPRAGRTKLLGASGITDHRTDAAKECQRSAHQTQPATSAFGRVKTKSSPSHWMPMSVAPPRFVATVLPVQ